MEGRSPRKKTKLRVQREFECSRIEQAMLASAYQTILPNDRVSFSQRSQEALSPTDCDNQLALQIDNADCSPHFASAIGGHSS